MDFDATDELLIRYSAFIRYWRKKWECNRTVHQLYKDFKKAYDAGGKYCTFSFNLIYPLH